VLEKLNVYNELSGITTNQSEGYNTLLKHYENWKEAPVDAFILGLYRLQGFYYNEIQRGYGGIGSYTLSPDFAHAAIAVDEIMSIPAIQPAEIVAKMKIDQLITPNDEQKPVVITVDDCENNLSSVTTSCVADIDDTKQGHGSNCINGSQNKSREVDVIGVYRDNQETNPTISTVTDQKEVDYSPIATNGITQLSRAK